MTGVKKMEIPLEDWKIYLECPNCGRERNVTSKVCREGITHYIKVILPKICIYCEEESNRAKNV